jgi:hypothetical protein
MKLLSLLLIPLAAAAAAQQPPAAPRPGSPPGAEAAVARAEGDDLALLVGLAPGQRPALDRYLAAVRPPRPERAIGEARPSFAGELDRREQGLTAERSRIEAARRFYEQLDAGQRQRFDALMRLRHGPGGPGAPGRPPLEGPDGPPPH